MAESTVKVVFLGDASKLKREVDGIDDSTSKAERGFGKLGAAIGGAVAVGSVVSLGKGAFDAAIESQKIAAQTEAAIKSTGAAAGITADEIGAMASAMSKKNAVDDEAIQTGQNLLLTFTNIGKTDKIFERTTQASIDMAAAMGTDVKSAAMQLGKALNDPADGLSKLTRAGIQFTDEQKKQIQTMQAAGDMAGAQAVMLGELERQFGGSAAAQATATDRMRIAFGNLQEEIGARLIPIVEGLSQVITERVIPFFSWLSDHIAPVAAGFAVLAGAILGAVVPAFIAWASAAIAAAAAQIAAAAPAIALGAAIAALAAGLVYAYQNVGWFRDSVDAVAQFITGTVVPAFMSFVGFLRENVLPVLGDIVGFIVNDLIPAFAGFVEKVIEVAADVQRVLFDIVGFFVALGTGIANVVASIVSTLAGWVADVWRYGGMVIDFFRDLPGDILDVLGDMGRLLFDIGKDIINGLWDGIKEIWNKMTGWIASAADKLPGFLKRPLGINSPSRVMREVGQFTMLGLHEGMKDGWSPIPGWLEDIGDSMADRASEMSDAMSWAVEDMGTAMVGSMSSTMDTMVDVVAAGAKRAVDAWYPAIIAIDEQFRRNEPTYDPDPEGVLERANEERRRQMNDSRGVPAGGITINNNISGVSNPTIAAQASNDLLARTLMSNQLRVALAGA